MSSQGKDSLLENVYIFQSHSDPNCAKAIEEMINKAVLMASKYISDPNQLDEFNRYISYTSISR